MIAVGHFAIRHCYKHGSNVFCRKPSASCFAVDVTSAAITHSLAAFNMALIVDGVRPLYFTNIFTSVSFFFIRSTFSTDVVLEIFPHNVWL